MAAETESGLVRNFGTLQATALNMSNMIGIGPFITIPLLMSAMGGPQALLGWLLAVLIVVPDGLVWSELGARLPGSGGSFVYLTQAFGALKWGRLMGFLFIWQFILSGPLEIASGYIGFAKYAGYLLPSTSTSQERIICVAIGLVNIVLLYRRIDRLGRLTVSLWIGTMLTVMIVILTGAWHFDPAKAFDFPAGAFNLSGKFLTGLGAAATIGVYDYLGYYDICYLGEEVRQPGKVIPRSIIISLIAVALIYILVNLSLTGVISWREFVPAESTQPFSNYVASIFMEKIYGHRVAAVFTAFILWTAFGSCFALLLGYSRIPYAAAREGYFFERFGRLSRGGFPAFSLVVIGVISIACSFFSLDTVIAVLLSTRIIVQFMGQIAGVILLRRSRPDEELPFRMWLYPLPAALAFAGWCFIFATSDLKTIAWGLGTIGAGSLAFLLWSRAKQSWPYRQANTST